jgi:hypothetical protein
MGFISDIFGGLTEDKKETSVNYLPEQIKDIQDTNKFKTDTIMPAYKDYMNQSKQGYEQALPGMNKAAQNLGGYAGQVGQTLGETGESAARVGVKGLESFFEPGYGQEQFAAAMSPIQGQYASNMANSAATFGGSGNMGSSRQALAEGQLAGQAQGQQMQAAANVMNQLNQQRLQAGQSLAQTGGNYLNQGLQAKGTQLGAAERPMDWTSQYGKQLGMVPSQLYTPQYPGQQSTTTSSSDSPLKTVGGILGMFK